jgi:ligand-binding sensor domain-containing protein
LEEIGVAAPAPTGEKRALATMTAGIVAIVCSHESRHSGIRRKASARSRSARRVAATVKSDSILWACECHESLLQPASIDRQSSRKKPSRTPRPTARRRRRRRGRADSN